jgi:hypothetical protein
MTLDELLLEWSYRSEKGYPCLDSPSDISVLKQILSELDIPTEEILDQLEAVRGDEEDEEIEGLEPNPDQEAGEKVDVDCDDIDEEELRNDLRKAFPNYSEDQIEDVLKYAINTQCKIPVNKAIQSKDWVINKKGKIDHKQLDEYTEQILKLSKNLTQQDQREWVNYLNNPDRHIAFEPTIGKVGNLLDDLKESGLPKQLLLNLMNHTGRDAGGKGVGAGEFGMSLVFSNIKASVGAGDLSLDGAEFEIKGQNATLGKRPDEVNALSLDKLAEFVDVLDDELGDNNVKLRYSKERAPYADPKKGLKKPANMLTYKGKLFQPAEFARIISDIYNATPNKKEFKQAFKEATLEIEKAAKQMHAEAVEQFWGEMKFDTEKEVQDSIALLNFYRYILKEGFTRFLAHDIGADGKGAGNYIYAEGDPMQMTLNLMKAGATFQPVNPQLMKPRIGFGGSFREEIS